MTERGGGYWAASAALRRSQWSAPARQGTLRHDIGQRHRAEIEVDLIAELFPEIVGEAARLATAAADRRTRRTARGADRLVDGEDDVGDARLIGAMAKEIAAAGPAQLLTRLAARSLAKSCSR